MAPINGKVFVTGGTGFIGSRVVKALIADGYHVTALSRRTGTDLEKLDGVRVVQGTLKDLNVIAAAAAEADAVLHLAFEHDFSKYAQSVEQDTAVIKAITKALAGSGKLFVTTSATGVVGDTGVDVVDETVAAEGLRAAPEPATLEGNDKGIRAVVMRLPPFVYAKDFSYFYDVMYKAAKTKGAASYVGTGDNKLCVVHVDDAVHGYVSCLRHKNARGIYNLVGENGVTSQTIAEIIAAKQSCKTESVSIEEAEKLFSPIIARLTSSNNQADSSKAKHELDWKPQYTSIREAI